MIHIARGNASRTSTRIPSTSSPPLLTANLPVAIRRSAPASRRRESHPDHDHPVLLKRERHDEMAKQTLQWLFLVVGQELQDCACFCLSFFRLKMHEVYAAASVHNPPVLWRTLHVNLRRLTRLTSSQHESWSVAMTQKATHHASQAQICAFHLLINTKSKYVLLQGSVWPRRWFTWPVFPCPDIDLVHPDTQTRRFGASSRSLPFCMCCPTTIFRSSFNTWDSAASNGTTGKRCPGSDQARANARQSAPAKSDDDVKSPRTCSRILGIPFSQLYLILNDTACGGDAILQRRRQPTAEHALQSALGACLWQRQQEPLRFNAGQGSGETPPPGLAGEPFGCSPARSSVPRRRRARRLCGHIQVLSSRLQLQLVWF